MRSPLAHEVLEHPPLAVDDMLHRRLVDGCLETDVGRIAVAGGGFACLQDFYKRRRLGRSWWRQAEETGAGDLRQRRAGHDAREARDRRLHGGSGVRGAGCET
jgi:hypothetical protein